MSLNGRRKVCLPPELTEWIDRVIIPALVRAYLAENPVASEAAPVAKCAAKNTASVGGAE